MSYLDSVKITRAYAPRRPRGGWDGWFAIGIFPSTSAVRWLKLHAFVSDAPPGRVPVAAVEGMEVGELIAMVGLADRTVVERAPLAASTVACDADRLGVRAAGRADWRGVFPEFAIDQGADGAVAARLRMTGHDVVRWIRAGGMLTYFGVHSTMAGEVTVDGRALPVDGFGIVEHAWGASLPFDPRRIARGAWQWDVLAFDEPNRRSPAAVAALASAMPLGKRLWPLAGRGRTPGGEAADRGGLRVRWRSARDGLPAAWRGEVAGAGETLVYEARAVGEPARVLPHGAFFGFQFEGEVRRGAAQQRVSGTGYCEFADPRGDLPSLLRP